MFDYLTKTSIINLKEFIVESINHLGWKSDLFTRSQGFFKSCLEVSMNIKYESILKYERSFFKKKAFRSNSEGWLG